MKTLFIVGAALLLGPVPARDVAAPGGRVSFAPEDVRLRIVEQINKDRGAHGLKPVEYAPELSRAADAHCEEMLREDYSSHWNREGLKPYMRYSRAGIRDNTSENVAAYWCTGCNFNLQKLLPEALGSHRRFMEEQPPLDGHRKSILEPAHTHVGIGLAYNETGFRMIELFVDRYATLDELPQAARLNQNFRVTGRVTAKGYELMAVSIFYEPLPQPLTLAQLKATYSYSLPDEERVERPSLVGTPRRYTDGTLGSVRMDAGGRFEVPLLFWKQRPGVYTVAVWVRRGREPAFIAATWPVMVQD